MRATAGCYLARCHDAPPTAGGSRNLNPPPTFPSAPTPHPGATLGHYLTPNPTGFSLHMSASPRNLRAVRGLTEATLRNAGVSPDGVDCAQLVLAELYSNAVNACGDYVPLVAEVEAGAAGVWVRLHDPDQSRMPWHSGVAMSDPEAESGRGLRIVDVLAPGWDVLRTPVGKQIRCLLPLD
ncbi:ATP-binding protein [Streptomyces sp. NPDC096310]|uniref:ATP-binding protein n=1 Tax=Streptomyces sp. NPDC096310 TaxID=3366082 RepID=UPI003807AF16